jgi:hypothetical protein
MDITNTIPTRSLGKPQLLPKPSTAPTYMCPRLPDDSVPSLDHECFNHNIHAETNKESQFLTPLNRNRSLQTQQDARSMGRGSQSVPITPSSVEYGSLLYNAISAAKNMTKLKSSENCHARKSSSVPKLAGNTPKEVPPKPPMMQDLFITIENMSKNSKNTASFNGSFDFSSELKSSNSGPRSILTFGSPSLKPKPIAKTLE